MSLKSLSRLVFSKSLDSIESFLKENKYEYEEIGKWGDNHMVSYYKPQNNPYGFERIRIIVDSTMPLTPIFEVMYLATGSDFYDKLKYENDTTKGIVKSREFFDEHKIHKIYCNGVYENNFVIVNSEEYTHIYTVWIKSNFACGL